MVWRQGRRARTVVRCGCPATQGRELVSGEAPVPYVTDAGTLVAAFGEGEMMSIE